MKNYAVLRRLVNGSLVTGKVSERILFFDDRDMPPEIIDTSHRTEWTLHSIPQHWSYYTGFRVAGEEAEFFELRQSGYQMASSRFELDKDDIQDELMARALRLGLDLDRARAVIGHVLGKCPYKGVAWQ